MFKDKVLLITGGTGSFGNAVLRRFLDSDLREIRIFSRDEKKQEDMRIKYKNDKIKFYIGDVRDYRSIDDAMDGVDYVFHAAALKQVPSCEFYPIQAVKTNILGTENVLEAAINHNVKKVIVLSTDKAAYPINAMGMSKALMEKVAVAKGRDLREGQTIICRTRYGNVMASRGSVIPLFCEQISENKPLTITNPDMTRFMMTLDDAVDLVVYAFEHGQQGDLFVQKAPAATISTLAQAIKELKHSDVPITCIGTRHGEKLYEVLVTKEEMLSAVDMGDYYRIPSDNRSLNYQKYIDQGNANLDNVEDYNSHNTRRLDVRGMKELLLKLDLFSDCRMDSMKVLVTGAKGFVGKNLISYLSQNENIEIFEYDIDSTEEELDRYTRECDFVFHLAGVNRPQNDSEYMEGNFGFTSILLNKLKANNNRCPIMVSSSIQAVLDNDYGKSKKAEEDLIFKYGADNGVKVYVYRFPNLFGKWCRPNYNSVIATFCNNIANDLEITVSDENKELKLAYIDDVCEELIRCLDDNAHKENEFCYVPITYTKSLGYIANLIRSFRENDMGIMVPSTGDEFTKKLYATYISYVPLEKMIVGLEEHRDSRGVFCELIRTKECGQVSISTTNPEIVRGGHYHHTKMERFVVVKGRARIKFENIITHETYEFEVSGDKLQYVTIPVGYQHSINNIGSDELVLLLWANELYDPKKADTYVMEGKPDEHKKRILKP